MTDAITGLKAQTTPFTANKDSPYHVAMGKFRKLVYMNAQGMDWDKSRRAEIDAKSMELSQAIMNSDNNIWTAGTTKEAAVSLVKSLISTVHIHTSP